MFNLGTALKIYFTGMLVVGILVGMAVAAIWSEFF